MDINRYLKFAESLKLVRNEFLEDEKSVNIIDEIYTDLLPQNGVINKVNLPRTTILVGRKGTGKSTIFQKSMKGIDGDKKIITLYIDVKTLYENSTPTISTSSQTIVPPEELIKYFIYKSFINQIIIETKNKLQYKLDRSFIRTVLGLDEEKYLEIEEELKNIQESIDEVFKKIDVSLLTNIGRTIEDSSEDKCKCDLELSKTPKITLGGEGNAKKSIKQEFNNTFITYLDIKKCLIENLLRIRTVLNLKYLYIYLDDYSEIDEEAQKLFMDWFIAPLNNLADNFIKFKIATYPKRFYYGKLDSQKFDEISLDFFEAFYTYKNISKMEELALDYTKRLINNRVKVFLGNEGLSSYFDIKDVELYELLFDLSMNIPRKMGYILSYCYESNLIHGNKITKAALGNAAVRYYDEVIKKYFESNPYILRPFTDRVSIENQKDLINKIVKQQVSNKLSIAKSSAKLFKVEGQPASHFVVSNELNQLLDNLELNGYISTYNKINDKNNIPSTLFSIDYGLCRKNNINYGRPKDTEFRKYYNDTRFNFNNLVRNHFNETQILKCEKGHEFAFELLEQFKKFSNMNCPTCLGEQVFSKVSIVVSNKELIERIMEVEKTTTVLSDVNEYNLLDCLKRAYPKSMSSTDIAVEIDCSWQFVNKRADKLIEKALIEIDDSKSNKKRYYRITRKARDLIFTKENITEESIAATLE
jgi:predicted transcriptional regulator